MNGRFSAAIVAFAVATAVVTRATTIPEFLVQLHDPNLLGGPLFVWLLNTLGYAFILSLCAVLTGATVLLVGWRTRSRGASDWHAALAAVLVVLCLTGRLGVSLDPIGWFCAALFCLLLDRDDGVSSISALGVILVWSLLQGGATTGALIGVLALAGSLIDVRGIDETVVRRAVIAAGALLIGGLQLHALPWNGYGAHALYLDALGHGVQRDRIWNGGISVSALGFALLIIVAGWYGVRRRSQSSDALVFFALFVLSLADARNLPYFAIAGAPVVADAVASYYVDMRKFPTGSLRRYAVTFAAAAAVFVASLTASEPKVTVWPRPPGTPAHLIALLRHAHTSGILCVSPRWCDGASSAVLDDRSGIASAHARNLEYDVVNTSGDWRSELKNSRINAVVAGKDDNVAALLTSTGWHISASDGTRVLLRPVGVQ